jgi:hypothetical protein
MFWSPLPLKYFVETGDLICSVLSKHAPAITTQSGRADRTVNRQSCFLKLLWKRSTCVILLGPIQERSLNEYQNQSNIYTQL